MRFAKSGYFIESYVKCANCGVLIYEDDPKIGSPDGGEVYCSDWCREWKRRRDAGETDMRMPLPRS